MVKFSASFALVLSASLLLSSQCIAGTSTDPPCPRDNSLPSVDKCARGASCPGPQEGLDFGSQCTQDGYNFRCIARKTCPSIEPHDKYGVKSDDEPTPVPSNAGRAEEAAVDLQPSYSTLGDSTLVSPVQASGNTASRAQTSGNGQSYVGATFETALAPGNPAASTPSDEPVASSPGSSAATAPGVTTAPAPGTATTVPAPGAYTAAAAPGTSASTAPAPSGSTTAPTPCPPGQTPAYATSPSKVGDQECQYSPTLPSSTAPYQSQDSVQGSSPGANSPVSPSFDNKPSTPNTPPGYDNLKPAPTTTAPSTNDQVSATPRTTTPCPPGVTKAPEYGPSKNPAEDTNGAGATKKPYTPPAEDAGSPQHQDPVYGSDATASEATLSPNNVSSTGGAQLSPYGDSTVTVTPAPPINPIINGSYIATTAAPENTSAPAVTTPYEPSTLVAGEADGPPPANGGAGGATNSSPTPAAGTTPSSETPVAAPTPNDETPAPTPTEQGPTRFLRTRV